jgi:hypothetical protein
VENLRCPGYRAGLAIEIHGTYCVNLRRRPQSTRPIFSVKGEAGVFYEEGFEPEVSSHAHRGFHDESVPPRGPELNLEVCADESAIRPLGDHVAGPRLDLRFEIVARLAGALLGSRFGRVMTNVIDGAPGGPPRIEQGSDISFRIRIVAIAPTRVIDRLLKIDHE